METRYNAVVRHFAHLAHRRPAVVPGPALGAIAVVGRGTDAAVRTSETPLRKHQSGQSNGAGGVNLLSYFSMVHVREAHRYS